jgi:hypothetical protein
MVVATLIIASLKPNHKFPLRKSLRASLMAIIRTISSVEQPIYTSKRTRIKELQSAGELPIRINASLC